MAEPTPVMEVVSTVQSGPSLELKAKVLSLYSLDTDTNAVGYIQYVQ